MSRDIDQKLRNIAKSAGVLWAGFLLEHLIAFFAQILAANYLSVADFGSVTTGTTLLSFGGTVATLGMNAGLARYLPRRNTGEKRMLVLSALLISLASSLAISAFIVLNAQLISEQVFNEPGITTSVQIFGIAIPFASTLFVGIGGIQGMKISHYRVVIENLLRPLIRLTFVVFVVYVGATQSGIATAYILPYIAGGVLAITLLLRSFDDAKTLRTPQSDDFELLFEFIRYSVPLTIASAANLLIQSADIFIVLYILGRDSVGIYGVAYAAGSLTLVFSTVFNYLAVPITSELESENRLEEMYGLVRNLLRWTLLFSLPVLVPFVVFSEGFITSVYRPEYATGARVLSILAVGFIVHNALSCYRTVFQAHGRSRFVAISEGIGAVVNVVLNFILIPGYGIEGAAFATAISYVTIDSLMVIRLWLVDRVVLIDRRTILAGTFVAVVFMSATFLEAFVPSGLLSIVSVSAMYVVVCAVLVVLLFGFSDEEAMLLRSVQEQYGVDLEFILRFVE